MEILVRSEIRPTELPWFCRACRSWFPTISIPAPAHFARNSPVWSSSAIRERLSCRDPLAQRRMRVEQPLDDFRGVLFGQVLGAETAHRGDERVGIARHPE